MTTLKICICVQYIAYSRPIYHKVQKYLSVKDNLPCLIGHDNVRLINVSHFLTSKGYCNHILLAALMHIIYLHIHKSYIVRAYWGNWNKYSIRLFIAPNKLDHVLAIEWVYLYDMSLILHNLYSQIIKQYTGILNYCDPFNSIMLIEIG